MRKKIKLYIARVLLLLWAGWWTFFGLASGISEKIGFWGTFIHTAIPGLIFLATVIIAWRWARAGGIILIAEALIVLGAYIFMASGRLSVVDVFVVSAILVLPPLAGGFLLLGSLEK